MTTLRRHPWWSLGGALLLVVLVVAVAGGLRAADPKYPAVRPGEQVDLGPFTLRLDSASLRRTDLDGDPLEDGKRLLVVNGTVLNTDTESGLLPGRLIQATFDGNHALEDGAGTGASQWYEPDLTTPIRLVYEVPAKTVVTDRVQLVLSAETYGWNNLLFDGPAWSGGQPVASLALRVRS